MSFGKMSDSRVFAQLGSRIVERAIAYSVVAAREKRIRPNVDHVVDVLRCRATFTNGAEEEDTHGNRREATACWGDTGSALSLNGG